MLTFFQFLRALCQRYPMTLVGSSSSIKLIVLLIWDFPQTNFYNRVFCEQPTDCHPFSVASFDASLANISRTNNMPRTSTRRPVSLVIMGFLLYTHPLATRHNILQSISCMYEAAFRELMYHRQGRSG